MEDKTNRDVRLQGALLRLSDAEHKHRMTCDAQGRASLALSIADRALRDAQASADRTEKTVTESLDGLVAARKAVVSAAFEAKETK